MYSSSNYEYGNNLGTCTHPKSKPNQGFIVCISCGIVLHQTFLENTDSRAFYNQRKTKLRHESIQLSISSAGVDEPMGSIVGTEQEARTLSIDHSQLDFEKPVNYMRLRKLNAEIKLEKRPNSSLQAESFQLLDYFVSSLHLDGDVRKLCINNYRALEKATNDRSIGQNKSVIKFNKLMMISCLIAAVRQLEAPVEKHEIINLYRDSGHKPSIRRIQHYLQVLSRSGRFSLSSRILKVNTNTKAINFVERSLDELFSSSEILDDYYKIYDPESLNDYKIHLGKISGYFLNSIPYHEISSKKPSGIARWSIYVADRILHKTLAKPHFLTQSRLGLVWSQSSIRDNSHSLRHLYVKFKSELVTFAASSLELASTYFKC
ncbi:MAG: hypothetical protein IH840_10480 [Candidatus Heimdallarchaeota archaeon]|nr:hypothetical protein [Candidatus Heimdallarchaeota archaeon]